MKVRISWFSTALIIYTIYCFTTVLRWLPAITVQMPIIMLCYLMLVFSVMSRFGIEQTLKFLVASLMVIAFNFIFIYLQSYSNDMSFVNKVGANFTLFVTTFPILLVYSGGFRWINKKRFGNIVFLIILITAITTIIGTFTYASPCRELATPYNTELDNLYKSQNIGGYGFIYSIVLLCPLVLKKLHYNFSITMLAFLATCIFCVIRSEYTTALLLLIFGIGISLAAYRKNIIISIAFIITFIAVAVNIEAILNWGISHFSESYTISSRLMMILTYIQYDTLTGNLLDRSNLYFNSINSFLRNPIFGGLFRLDEVNIGGHSEIFDYIGHSGLFGLIVLYPVFKAIRKMYSFRLVKKDSFFVAMIIIAIILAAINTFSAPELFYVIFIMPILFDDTELNSNHYNNRYILK